MAHEYAHVEQDFRVTFPGPFQQHDVVVDGWSVPFVKASFRSDAEDHVRLILDDRIGLDLTSAEAEKLMPFLADAISIALGYGAHPSKESETLPERTPHMGPRRVVRVGPELAG